ncbi:MAG: ribonuclease D [Thiofilum sp.]|uniref:ribonuclease D n=1 Tax=Thiofilum sp. TaxID=2212733 RepID=UPI0025CBF80F|nr:ribonuclease D [Thiofilum sp.]MBK8452839.1 ribonuclease D [Thiofilum sp.]
MFDYIATTNELQILLADLSAASWVALDTEFIREKTYYPQLCLIQLATEKRLVCIDPLTINDLSPLWAWLQQPNLLKILHAGSQDLEIFYHLSGQVPTPVFDTQIAAAVLGLGDQLGYGRLVESLLGINLDKSQSRTDWAARPLRHEQLDYAIDDVRYLKQIYPILQQQLKALQRDQWVYKSFAKLTDPSTYTVDTRESWKRVKNNQLLKPQQLSVLRELAAWRESEALHKNLPKRWLLSDDILVDMARMRIQKLEDFKTIRGLKDETIQQAGAQWLKLIQTGLKLPASEWPQPTRRRTLDAELALLTDLLMVVVGQQALHYNISPQMLATRPQIEKMLIEQRTALSEDWRGSILNEVFEAILAGKKTLAVNQQKVLLQG